MVNKPRASSVHEEAALGHCFFLYRLEGEEKLPTRQLYFELPFPLSVYTYDCPMKSRISRKSEAKYSATVGGNTENRDPHVLHSWIEN